MFASASGELKTRSRAVEPLESRRHLEDAALALALGEHGVARGVGDVLAEDDDRADRASSRPRRQAFSRSTIVVGGAPSAGAGAVEKAGARRVHVRRVDEVVGGLGLGQRGRERAVGRLVDLRVDLGVEPLEIRLR